MRTVAVVNNSRAFLEERARLFHWQQACTSPSLVVARGYRIGETLLTPQHTLARRSCAQGGALLLWFGEESEPGHGLHRRTHTHAAGRAQAPQGQGQEEEHVAVGDGGAALRERWWGRGGG